MKVHTVPRDSRRLDENTRAELVALVREWQALLGSAHPGTALPADDAVNRLLHSLGDDAPVDDFEAGRRRERRRYPRFRDE